MKLEFKNLSYNDVQKKFNYIQEVYDKGDNDPQLEIDFCKLKWTEPIGMLFFGAKLREFSRNNPEVEITLGNIGQDSGYFEWMGLYDYFIPDSNIGKKVGHVFGNTNYIPITKINVKAEYGESFKNGNIYADRGEFIEVRANQLAQTVTSDRQLEKILTYIIREIIRNVPEHSGIDEFWICGQAWHGKLNKAQIAILDEGQGIFNSLTSNIFHRREIESNTEALQSAVQPGISKAFKRGGTNRKSNDVWANSGYGLYVVSEICRDCNGKFGLISGENILIKNNDASCPPNGIVGDNCFNGTAIIIELPFINDYSSISISDYVTRGEKLAKQEINSIHQASIPSRGLLK